MQGNGDSAQKNKTLTSGAIFLLLVFLIIDLYSIVVGFNQARGVGSFFGYSGGRLLALLMVILVTILTSIGIVRLSGFRKVDNSSKTRNKIAQFNERILKFRKPGLIGVVLAYFVLLVTQSMGIKIPLIWYFPTCWLFGSLGVLGAFFLSSNKNLEPAVALLFSLSLMGFGFILYTFLPEISNYPLSSDWSESSRFYDASLFFSRLVYGKRLALPVLDPSRALLQSFPYLIPNLPIWAHRLWRTILWIGMALLAGYFLVRRLKLKNKWLVFSLIMWFVIYTFLCPVYFHLMVIPLIIFAFFDKTRLWRSIIFIVFASIWAGISRVNWFPAAGILAAVLYILEVPKGDRKFWAYWVWPVSFIFGSLAIAFGTQALYMLLSGNPPQAFITSFNSPLYFYRLLPSEAYGIGVFGHLLIASLPLLGVIFVAMRKKLKQWWGLRHLALLSILLVLMLAGLIVSTKIGGGNNLHNLDLFLISLLVVTINVVFNGYQKDKVTDVPQSNHALRFLALTALIPSAIFLARLSPLQTPDNFQANAEIEALQALIDQAAVDGDEILFIQNRHLLAQNMIDNVDLVSEYDTVFLMEMAMSNNTAYLDQFHQDLQSHRFSLIVIEPVYPKKLATSSHSFAEEHNCWTEQVSVPLMADYHIVLDFSQDRMVVLMPDD